MIKSNQKRAIRCAIYTRKSTEEGLEQEFNSLDAQRESGEAYITSQKAEGWVCMPDRYDDGGFSGGNMDRPAVQRLLADITAGKIDCVVVYKVDRLSRSLLDFAKMMETFEKHKVSFVSVTQQFNTASSMGRLILNVLLSFAQFEREIISERTRDKIAAARRKGKWTGGQPVLGYDIDTARGRRLVVNEDEAQRVRSIFDLYLRHESLLGTIAELDTKGWTSKEWTTSKGARRGGRRFDKSSLFALLTNVLYVGRVRHKAETYQGEHPAIVEPSVFERVQRIMKRNGRSGGPLVRNRFGAILRGLLYCSACNSGMVHTHTTRAGNKRYRYYVCHNAQSRGWHNCPSPSIPAGEVERFVVDQIRSIGNDPGLIAEVIRQCRREQRERAEELRMEERAIERELASQGAALHKLAGAVATNGHAADRLADIQERLQAAERRLTEVRTQLAPLEREAVDAGDVGAALSAFDPVWDALSPREQTRVLNLLIERVEYDGRAGEIAITFRPTGLQSLTAELEVAL